MLYLAVLWGLAPEKYFSGTAFVSFDNNKIQHTLCSADNSFYRCGSPD